MRTSNVLVLLVSSLLSSAVASHRTLFIGNSYVYFNGGVEQYYANLVNAHFPADQAVTASAVARPNYFLRQHLSDGQPADGDWTHLVLQEQSQTPGFPDSEPELAPSRAAFAKLATAAYAKNGARCIVLLQTWGRRDGDSENPELYPDFASMQARLSAGYESMAEEVRTALTAQAAASAAIDVRVAPAGEAFAVLHKADPQLFRSLYHADGAHPSVAGSYLTACVVACTLHRELKPEDLTSYVPDELEEDVAQQLRDAAREALSSAARS